MVDDISVSGAKLHVSYSDGTSKDMDMPPATSLRLLNLNKYDGYVDGYTIITSTRPSHNDDGIYFGTTLLGTTYYNYGPVRFELTGE